MNSASETSACSRCVTYLVRSMHDRKYSPRYSPRSADHAHIARCLTDAAQRYVDAMRVSHRAAEPYCAHSIYCAAGKRSAARVCASSRAAACEISSRYRRDIAEISPRYRGMMHRQRATGPAPAAFYGKVSLSFSKIHLHLDQPGRRAGRGRRRVGGRFLGRLEPLRDACTDFIARDRKLTAHATL